MAKITEIQVPVEKRVAVDPAFKLFGRTISLISPPPPQDLDPDPASSAQAGGCRKVSMEGGIDTKMIESANEATRSLKTKGDMNNNDKEAGESSNSAVSAEKNDGEEVEEEEEGEGEDGRKEEKHARCPRCDSGETKFCYYNNYNVNQPRHFCKNCQRYWTAGGTLRNVPVGAGRRRSKNPSPYQRQVAAVTATLTATGVLEGGGEGGVVRQDAPDLAHSPHSSPFSSGSASVLSFRREIEPRVNQIKPRIHQFDLSPLLPQTKTQSSTVLSFSREISPPSNISSLPPPPTHNFLAPPHPTSHSEITNDPSKHFGDDSASSSLCTQQPDAPLPLNPNYEEKALAAAKQAADIANYAKGAACLMGWNGLWGNYMPWNPATQAPIWYPSPSSHFLNSTNSNNNKPILTPPILAKQYPPLAPAPTFLLPIKIEPGHSLRIDDPVEAARSSLWPPAFRSDQQH